jgi:hypothetical protein
LFGHQIDFSTTKTYNATTMINTSVSTILSDDIQDIIEINRKSVSTKDVIRIMELSTLSDIVPKSTAEHIRTQLVKNNVQVKQLTNQKVFFPWTTVKGFVEECMTIHYIPKEILPIEAEVLIFDNTVAIYQVEPKVSVTIIKHPAFANQQKALFDNFWHIANPLSLSQNGSTTYAVTIKRSPKDVFDYISNLANWPEFSDFAANFERVTDREYIAHTSQGDIRVIAQFDADKLLLDTQCVLPSGEIQTIPYRVVPNQDGAELMMTNFKPISATTKDYQEQLHWMKVELNQVKNILEKNK